MVPTATLVRHLRHELARDGVAPPPRAVVSLNTFVAERAPADLRLAPDGLLRILTRDALDRLRPHEFADVAESAGMVSTILDTISLFENADCTPDRLLQARRLSPHARAFERIWRAVDAGVRECGFVSRAALFRAAGRAAAANTAPPALWFDGFLNLSPLERGLVASLAGSCDLTLTLDDSPGAADLHRFALRLGARGVLLTGAARRPETIAVSAPSIEREADEIARRVIELHRAGAEFRQIAVALRDTEIYEPLLRATFERFGIPARFYFAAPLRHHPASRFLSGILDCALNGWDFETALDALRCHPQWGAGAAFDEFDFRVREKMPGSGAENLLGLADDRLRGRLAEIVAIDAWVGEQAPPRVWAERLEGMAARLYRPGVVDIASGHARLDAARSHAAALQAWVECVHCAADSWTDKTAPVPLARFHKALCGALDAATFRTPDDRRDVVHAMNVYEARQWDIPYLFVCGVTERDFPRRQTANLLFPDAEVQSLRKAGIELQDPGAREADEAALWSALRSSARSGLVLTWPEREASGRSVVPSRYVAELEAVRARFAMPSSLPLEWAPLDSAGIAGRIESPALLREIAAKHTSISITSLENMMGCRFKFFAERTLGLRKRPERPAERLQPRTWGLIMHDALEAWLNRNRQGDFVELFEAAFDRFCLEKRLPPGYRLEVERIKLRDTARRVSATERWEALSSQTEVELEIAFSGGIRVNGRADRIDLLNERDCLIVDYKSGKVGNVERMADSATRLQGPLYALGARERFGYNTVAMMYIAVREDKRFGWGSVPGAELGLQEMPPNWMEDARGRAEERIRDFLGGAVHADPADPDGCRWCDFRNACRVEQRGALVQVGAAHG